MDVSPPRLQSVTSWARADPLLTALVYVPLWVIFALQLLPCRRREVRPAAEPADTNAIVRIAHTCPLTDPGLTVVIWTSSAVTEADSGGASSNGGARRRRLAFRARGCDTEDDDADPDRDELSHVSITPLAAEASASAEAWIP